MSVEIIKNAGFCFGVSRAMKLLYDCIDSDKRDIYTLGEIIHNPDIIKEITEKGVSIADSVNDIPDGCTVVVRAHGITRDEMSVLSTKKINVVDATCPFVSKIQDIVKRQSDMGDVILIGGDKKHPEV